MKNTGFAQGLYEVSSAQKEIMGMLRIEPDGRKFRYAQAGAAALGAGKIGIMVGVTANHINLSVAAAAAIGATSVTVTLGATAATADQYKDGYLQVNDGTGEGHSYLIDTNAAAALSTSCEITLKDPIQVALVTAATSQVSLIPNPWKGVTESATSESGPAGIPLKAVPISYYYWCQTGGVAVCLAEGTDALGTTLELGAGAGGVKVQAGYTCGYVGTLIGTAFIAGEYKPILLALD